MAGLLRQGKASVLGRNWPQAEHKERRNLSTVEQLRDHEKPEPKSGQVWGFVLKRPIVSLSLLCAVLFLSGLTTLPPLDRDESRFAQATSQMLETGDFIDIRFQEDPRYQKPVGIYWLQALSVAALSDASEREIWAYRLPSALAAWLAVLLTFWGVRRLFDTPTAVIAAGLLAVSVVVMAEANIAKTDATLLATIAAAQICLGLIYCGAQGAQSTARFAVPGPLSLGFWIAVGVGLLIKGPVIVMVCGLTILALCLYDRDISWLRRLSILPGLVIVAAIVLPWAGAIWQLTDGEFFMQSVGGDMLDKVKAGQESHGAPPGYFTVLSFVTFWPGCLFLIPALYWAWTQRANASIRFLLAWVIPAWIAFEIVPTKLPHYTMPLYPALAGLCSAWIIGVLSRGAEASGRFPRLEALNLILFAVISLVLAFVIAPVPYLSSNVGISLGFAVIFGAIIAAAIIGRLRNSEPVQTVALLVLAALVWNGSVKWVTIPSATDFYVSPKLAEAVTRAADGKPSSVAVSGYREPSLVFLLGTETKLTDPKGAARELATIDQAFAIIDSKGDQAFLDRAQSLGIRVESLETVTGVNYSRGDEVELRVYRRVDE